MASVTSSVAGTGEPQKRHTILLVQFDEGKESRSYVDYESVSLAMEGVCQLYEQNLKSFNPKLKSVTYDLGDLFSYIDQLGDLCCLVFHPQNNVYIPYNKEWIKEHACRYLKAQVR
eukprot:TRINITY_DN12544_c0_g1_i7.p1 TRINITY_DN12544_c0_g1~~TRINITY_DN12544_c0_g1_i7.p1  ORF type:complete len:116 (+),score=29.65 TRINITY_DN12544_c0_g1_i7:76-423(+)